MAEKKTVVYHRLVNIQFQGHVAKFKIRGTSNSRDIKETVRNRFDIHPDAALLLTDSEGFIVVLDHTLQSGYYDLHVNADSFKSLATVKKEYTLYKYEHCPYCARVTLILGWKNIVYGTVIFGYGDHEGPKKLVGKKIAPILAYIPRSNEAKEGKEVGKESYMGESLDIVKFLEGREGSPLLKPETKRADLEAWNKAIGEPAGNLQKPRMRKIFTEDFAKKEDLDYHSDKYKVDFDALFAKSADFIKQADGLLKEFESFIKGDKTLNEGGLSYDDLIYLPTLRNLTYVKGLTWPAKVKEYVQHNCARGGLTVYFDQAI